MTKWGEKNGIEFLTIPPEKAEECLLVLRDGFFTQEAFCCAVGIDIDAAGQRELENLCLDVTKDNCSIMAVDKETKQIAGVSFNKIQTVPPPGKKSYFEEFRDSKCKTKSAKDLISEMMWFDNLADLYGMYNADCSLEVMFLGTHPDFRKRGISIGCVEYSLAMGATLTSPRPVIATAIFTSPYSIRTGRSLKFDEIVHVPMEEKFFEGKPFTDHPKVGPHHPGAIVMAKRI